MANNNRKVRPQKDKNTQLTFILESLFPYIQAGSATIQYCKVTRVNDNRSEADCQPLALQSDGDKRAMLLSCPVIRSAREWYETGPDKDGGIDITIVHKLKVGDVVVVGFNDRDTDNFTGSGFFSLASRRMHSINDGVVLGVLT